MKKGFTLIELIGVIVILALIMLVALPPIIEQVRKSKEAISDGTVAIILSATEDYIEENKNDYAKVDDQVYCLTLQTLVDANLLPNPLKDIRTNNDIILTNKVTITVNKTIYEYTYNNGVCTAS